MEAAQNERLGTKYFRLQASDLQKSAQKILQAGSANAPLPE